MTPAELGIAAAIDDDNRRSAYREHAKNAGSHVKAAEGLVGDLEEKILEIKRQLLEITEVAGDPEALGRATAEVILATIDAEQCVEGIRLAMDEI